MYDAKNVKLLTLSMARGQTVTRQAYTVSALELCPNLDQLFLVPYRQVMQGPWPFPRTAIAEFQYERVAIRFELHGEDATRLLEGYKEIRKLMKAYYGLSDPYQAN